jgi:hypothetical protein
MQLPFNHWVVHYAGLGHATMIDNDTPMLSQYYFSFYWVASTLSTASRVGFSTPKNTIEVVFTIVCMMTTLTVYAYVMGEITNLVMNNDEALVQKRQNIALVQSFVMRRQLMPDLTRDVVNTCYDRLASLHDTDRVFDLLSSSLQVCISLFCLL